MNSCRWTYEECNLYKHFIKINKTYFRNQIYQNQKMFRMMSEFIKTKSPTQCRSHHQKFLKKVLEEIDQNNSEINENDNLDNFHDIKDF